MRRETGLFHWHRPDAPLSILICKRLKGALSHGSSASFHAWFTLICLIGHTDLETDHLPAETVQIFSFLFFCTVLLCKDFWLFFIFLYFFSLFLVEEISVLRSKDLSYPSRKEFLKCCDCAMNIIYIEITVCNTWKGAEQWSACSHKIHSKNYIESLQEKQDFFLLF